MLDKNLTVDRGKRRVKRVAGEDWSEDAGKNPDDLETEEEDL